MWIDDATVEAIDAFAATGELPHGGDNLCWIVRCEDGQQYRMELRRVHEGDWRQMDREEAARLLYYAWHGHDPDGGDDDKG